MSTIVTNQNYKKEVLEAKEPVLIDFFADWCMPCKMLSPVIEEIGAELSGVKVCKINVDEEPDLAQQFGVMSIPTLVVMKEGVPVQTTVGVRPKKEIISMLEM